MTSPTFQLDLSQRDITMLAAGIRSLWHMDNPASYIETVWQAPGSMQTVDHEELDALTEQLATACGLELPAMQGMEEVNLEDTTEEL